MHTQYPVKLRNMQMTPLYHPHNPMLDACCMVAPAASLPPHAPQVIHPRSFTHQHSCMQVEPCCLQPPLHTMLLLTAGTFSPAGHNPIAVRTKRGSSCSSRPSVRTGPCIQHTTCKAPIVAAAAGAAAAAAHLHIPLREQPVRLIPTQHPHCRRPHV
jgi:hypothetical protein